MTEALTFVVPVRHHGSVSDWASVASRLAETASSLAAQTSRSWRAVIVANRGAALPVLPAGCEVERVDLPLVTLPKREHGDEAFFEAVRADKGRRVLAGMLAARPRGHVMVVDYDDFVSNRLAAFVGENAAAPGWYLDSGYLYDGARFLYRVDSSFSDMCGTSHLVRADLLALPGRAEAASDTYIRRIMGSHRFVAADLAAAGTPLEPLPFVGAVYRVGFRDATSHSSALVGRYFRPWMLRKRPLRFARDLLRLKRIDRALAREYFAAPQA